MNLGLAGYRTADLFQVALQIGDDQLARALVTIIALISVM
jgi:hypothetical protein